MRLDISKPNVETYGLLDEKLFSIGDTGMIFDILRNKLYSDPILAICREYSCNARDSHRENNTPDKEIHIHLPNNLEPYYKVKDFGVGISPDRIENVFIRYGVSTKREDNIQVGSFGLGAKCAFSLTDSFSIITNYNGIQYNYNCIIDETKVGKLMLASESKTKENNSTEIIIPVLPKDFNNFIIATEKACRHWDVKPIIKGGTIKWQETSKVLEGKNWAIISSNDYYRAALAVIDGVEYPLNIDSLRTYASSKLIESVRGNIILYFNTGDLSLSANREQIYLDEKTKRFISSRLKEIENDILQKVNLKLDTFTNLWDAAVYHRKELSPSFYSIDFLGTLLWKGLPIPANPTHIGCPSFSFTKGKFSRKHGADPDKLSRCNSTYLSFEPETALFINDLSIKEPTPRHVKKAFDDDPTLKQLLVICPTDKVTLKDLNDKIHINHMNPRLLSTITKATARAYKKSSSRLLIFKFDKAALAFRQVSLSSLEEDLNEKVLCSLIKNVYPQNSRSVILKNKKKLDIEEIRSLSNKYANISFYGIDEDIPESRVNEDFLNVDRLDDFLQNKVIDGDKKKFIKIKYASQNSYNIDENKIKYYDKIKGLIKNSGSPYIKRLDLHKKIKQIITEDSGVLHIYELMNDEITKKDIDIFIKDNPEYDIHSINNESQKRYPILNHINYYNWSDITGDIAEYINLIDTEKGI